MPDSKSKAGESVDSSRVVGCLVRLMEASRASGFDRGRGNDDSESRRAEQQAFDHAINTITELLTPNKD